MIRVLRVEFTIVKTFSPDVVVETGEVRVNKLVQAIEDAETRCNLIRILNETGGLTGKEPVNEELLAIRVGGVKILENIE